MKKDSNFSKNRYWKKDKSECCFTLNASRVKFFYQVMAYRLKLIFI